MFSMKRLIFLFVTAGFLGFSVSASAAGPIDAEANIHWWFNDLDVDAGSADIDAGSIGGDVQLWWRDQWGIKGALYQADVDDDFNVDDVNYLSVDIKRRLLSITENNYLAAGAGWQRVDLSSGENSDGLRLVLQGQVGLSNLIYLYGQSAWLPVFSDTDSREDIDAFELEAGIGYTPFPFVRLRAGWRQFDLDASNAQTGTNASEKTSGFIVGAGLSW